MPTMDKIPWLMTPRDGNLCTTSTWFYPTLIRNSSAELTENIYPFLPINHSERISRCLAIPRTMLCQYNKNPICILFWTHVECTISCAPSGAFHSVDLFIISKQAVHFYNCTVNGKAWERKQIQILIVSNNYRINLTVDRCPQKFWINDKC